MSSIVCPACKAYLGLSAAGAAACPKCAAPLAAPRSGPSPQERDEKTQADRDVVHGALWLIGGLVVTGVSYLAAAANGEGTYILAWGAIVFGGIQFLSGLYRSAAGPSVPDVGSCRRCGHSPVEPNTGRCPRCNARDPNPTYFYRYVGRSMLFGVLACAGVGAILALGSKDADKWGFAAAFGAFFGLVAGMVVGMALSILRWLVRGR